MPRPQVIRLSTTPIKGFALNHPESVELDEDGAIGDRAFFIVDANESLISIAKIGAFASFHVQFDPARAVLTLTSSDGTVFEDNVVGDKPVVVDFWESRDVAGQIISGPWSKWLSDVAGQQVSLVRAVEPDAGFDERPVTLISEESVAELGRVTQTPDIDPRRFRMLIDICGVSPYEEETWRGQQIKVGSAVLHMGGPVPRCNATARNPDTGQKDLKTLRLLAEGRGLMPNEFGEDLNLGVYADVVKPGVVSVGDEVTIESPGQPLL